MPDPTYETKTYNYNEPGTQTITVIGRVVYYVLPFDLGFWRQNRFQSVNDIA